jgi:hypothetical protein
MSQTTCLQISTNSTSGVYGMYSGCDGITKLGVAFNAYYQEQTAKGNGANACNFNGSAVLQSSSAPSGTCASVLSSASATATATIGSSGSGSTSKSAAPVGVSMHTFGVSNGVQFGLYSAAAVVTGLFMIWL